MYGGHTLLHVDVLCIDIDTRRLQITIERQCLVDLLAHGMQPHVLVDAAIVAEEVAVVPLIPTVGHLAVARIQFLLVLAIVPTVVDENGQHIVTGAVDVGSKVETEGHHAILAPTQFLAVKENAGGKAHALKLDEEFLAVTQFNGQHEVLAIPGRGVGQVVNFLGKSLMLVVRVGKRHPLPLRVIALRGKTALVSPYLHQPPRIEVIAVAGKG